MATRIPAFAALSGALVLAAPALAHLSAPLVPTALVEDVTSTTAGVEFMDYLGTGQVVKLQPHDVLVLSYLKSCEHETITGGTVTVGMEHSEVQDGKIVRTKVACSGGKMQLASQEASNSAASAFRLQSADVQPKLYDRSPMFKIPKLDADESRTLVVERLDKPGERVEIKIDDNLAGGGFYDFATAKKLLTLGAIYSASIGDRKIMFKIDAKATTGKTPIVSRLLRFQLN